MKSRKILITGAGGFIGSHLAERLVELGASVTAFVHYNALGNRGWLDKSMSATEMRIVAGDITDRDSVMRVMKGQDIVFHLAALIAIPYSYYSPASYVRTNVEGTLNVLQSARECSVERIIHTSTSEVYGSARYVPIDEQHPLQGQSPYAASKIGADKMAEAFHLSYGLPIVTVRPFNTFGPRQSARAIIPTIISQYLVCETIKLGNLTPTRDLNYVSNTVDGFVAAAKSSEAVSQTINLGSGFEISIGDLVQTIGQLMGKSAKVIAENQRIRQVGSEVERLLANNQLASNLLRWQPKIGLEEGLMRTIEWVSANHELYRPNEYTV